MYIKARSWRLKPFAIALGIVLALFLQIIPRHAAAATLLGTRSDKIDNPTASATARHMFTVTMLNTSQSIGSLSFEFCANSPLPNSPCTPPAGVNVSGTSLASQTGDVGFSIHPNTSSNRIVVNRPPLNPLGVTSTYEFVNITNPSSAGSFYVRLQSYASSDGTGSDVENGGVVFVIRSGVNVSAEVPPYIRFCVAVTISAFDCSTATSFLIDYGELSPTTVNKATSQFLVATNAQSGYSITLSGTTMISGTNVIPGMASAGPATPGTSQFGINLRANTSPAVGSDVVGTGTSTPNTGYNTPNQYKFNPGDIIVTVNHSDSNRKYTVSYITNVSTAQPAGFYATTLTYICLANF